MARRAESATGPFLAVAGALATAGAGTATWVVERAGRTVGGVTVAETATTEGTTFAPLAFVAGLGGLLLALAVLALRAEPRRVTALLLVVVGVLACGAVGVGVGRAVTAGGAVTVWPWIALAGAAALLAGGLLAFGRPGRRMAARYDIDAPPADDEWRMASEPGDGTADDDWRMAGDAPPDGPTR